MSKSRNRILPGTALSLLVAGWLATSSEAKVYIDIDSPGFRPLPLALLALEAVEEGTACPDAKMPEKLAAVLVQDLEVCGYFRILSPDVFLIDKKNVKLHPEPIDFHAWALIGAEALILLKATCQEGKVYVEAQLLDVLTGKLLTWKRYVSGPDDYRQAAHRFASEVEAVLTGIPGPFDSRIVYVSNASGSKELYVMDYDGYGSRKLTELHSISVSPAWSRDGKQIVFTSFWKQQPGLCLLDLTGKSGLRRLLPGFSPLCSGGAWSVDGAWIAFSASLDGNTELFRIRSGGKGRPQRLTRSWSIDVSPSWAQDGKRMVFVSDRAGRPDLYILYPEEGKVRRLTFHGSYNADPEWSPRGDKIAFVSRVGPHFQIFTIRSDGRERMQLTDGSGDHLSPTWAPDGRLIAFSSNDGGSYDLHLVRADGTGARRLTWTPHDESDPAWSPGVSP